MGMMMMGVMEHTAVKIINTGRLDHVCVGRRSGVAYVIAVVDERGSGFFVGGGLDLWQWSGALTRMKRRVWTWERCERLDNTHARTHTHTRTHPYSAAPATTH